MTACDIKKVARYDRCGANANRTGIDPVPDTDPPQE